MALHEVTFASANGRDEIQAWIHVPAAAPRGVVQIIHGLGEHSRRYLHLITALLDAGFVVAADDHAGHGRTAMRSGVWQDAGEDGASVVVQDEQTLREIAAERFPGLPHIVFGHSWGSIATDLDRIWFGPVPTPSHVARVPHQFHAPLLAEPPEAEYGALGGSFRRAPDRGAAKAAKSCGSQWAHPGRGSERSSQDARIGPGRGLRSSAVAPGPARSAPQTLLPDRLRSPAAPVSPVSWRRRCKRHRPRR